ncbi:MAG: DNA polymerase III subunit gamma/tau, partial [Burkholderiales bacterium]
MSYLVLARKYRPKNFAQLVGQEHVVQALANALKTGRLHHAYLFTGTRGVGKTTVSRILAKSLNCQGPDGTGGITDEPCGVCDACSAIDAGRFVDYTELDAASNRGVDEVQSLLEQAVYKPVQGRFKVFMIDEVHMLTGHAFNAMLKTLEEPPEYLKFVLATTDPQKVPVTVLSRCLQFNLRPMAPETVLSHLTGVLASESVDAETQALRLIARAARGSMRDALSLTDQAIAFGAGKLEEAAVRQMLGSVDRSHGARLIEALGQGDGKVVIEVAQALRLHGLSASATLEDMSEMLARMAVLQALPDAESQADAATDPDAAQIERLAALMPRDETQLLYSICLHGRAELGLAPDEYSGMTMVLLRLLAFKPPTAAAQQSTKAASAEKKTADDARAGAAKPLAAPRTTPQAPAALPGSDAVVRPDALDVLDAADGNAAPDSRAASGAAAPPVLPIAPEPPAQPAPAAGAAAEPDPPQPAPMVSPPFAANAGDGDFWHATVQRLIAADAVSALVRELALQSQLIGREGERWRLRVESQALSQPAVRERLTQALAAAGHGVSLEVEVGPVADSPARRNAQAAEQAQRDAEQVILADPFVQSMMRDFGAKIVPGSVKSVVKPVRDPNSRSGDARSVA